MLFFIYFGLFRQRYPVNRAPFCLLFDRGREKDGLPESCQAFEGSTAQSSGLVSLVLSRQASFLSASIRLWYTNRHNWARCIKRTAITPGFETYSSKLQRTLSKDLTRFEFAKGEATTTAMVAKTSLRKWIRAASNFIALIPSRSIRQMLVNISRVEF